MEHHQKDLDTRKLKVIGNVCASYLKEGDWVNTKRAADIGLRHMEKASLKDDAATAKFLYRKGYANLERGFCEDAFEALKRAEKLLPGDKQVRHALKLAGEGKKIDREKAKEVYRAVLLTDEEKACRGPDWHWSSCCPLSGNLQKVLLPTKNSMMHKNIAHGKHGWRGFDCDQRPECNHHQRRLSAWQ